MGSRGGEERVGQAANVHDEFQQNLRIRVLVDAAWVSGGGGGGVGRATER